MPVSVLLRWCEVALARLGEAREEIDALNVYPVPDGDTGTNLYLTFEAARDAVLRTVPDSRDDALRAFARGALLGARGNSGVILSQLLRAGADRLIGADAAEDGALLADMLTAAADAAYAAVADPVEGTILTVARAAADAAQRAVDAPGPHRGGVVVAAAASAARTALEHTPDQLHTLKMAGVVDAGGRGLCVILDAAEEVLTGRRAATAPLRLPVPIAVGNDLSADGPSYEVMFLLDADDGEIPPLRRRLRQLGDSLVVVGGQGLWNVHVHVDDVGAAIEAGIDAGRPYRVRVTHFAEQRLKEQRLTSRKGRGVVAIAAGDGLDALFAEAGARVLRVLAGRRSSTGELLEAIRATVGAEVIVLPNDSDSIAVAEAAAQAARDDGVRVAVIPSRAQIQGLAAIAVHDPGRSFDDDVVHMTSAAGHARHGAVTIAARDAMTTAGPCRTGDALGVVDGDFAIVGDDLQRTAIGVVDRLLSGGGEMVTLVTGAEAEPELARAVAAHVESTRSDVEVVVYAGGQDRYPLLVGVE